MKTYLIALNLLAGLLAAQLHAADAPKVPGPEHRQLEVWTGKWKHSATVLLSPFGPAGSDNGRSVARFVHGGSQVEAQGRSNGPQGPSSWTEVYSYDRAKQTYGCLYYGSDGLAGIAPITLNGNTWTFTWEAEAQGKSYKCQSVVTFMPDGKCSTVEWSYSEDGVAWKPWLSGKSTKIGKVR